MDTYALETNVHFPTDMSLLWDAGRKGLDIIEDAIKEGILDWKGWRKGKYWRKELKKLMRISAKASSGAGKNRRMVRPGQAKIKGKTRETGKRTMFLAKTQAYILKLPIGAWKIVPAFFQKWCFRSDTKYEKDVWF